MMASKRTEKKDIKNFRRYKIFVQNIKINIKVEMEWRNERSRAQ